MDGEGNLHQKTDSIWYWNILNGTAEGTLYQKKSNKKWYWVVPNGHEIIDGKKKYKQKWIDLETTDKAQAKTVRDSIKADIIKTGRYDPPTNQTVGEWLDFWLTEVARPKVRDTTYDFYEYIIRVHIKPKLGSRMIKHLHAEELQKFFNAKRKEKKLGKKKDEKGNFIPTNDPLSTRTLKGIEIVLSMALTKAVGMRKIPDNPMAVLDRIEYKRKEVGYMTSEQVADFLDKIRYDRWYYVFLTDLGTGMRLGELAALKWVDVNLAQGTINVNKAVADVKTYTETGPKTKKVIQDTKSEKGKRTIPLPDDVVAGLKKWKEIQTKERWEWEQKRHKEEEERAKNPDKKQRRKHHRPEYFKSGYVFTRKDGHPVSPNYLSKHFLKLVREHGYEGLTFHTQRHSYASMLLEAGEDMKVIQENLGDASLKIVSDTYTHVAEALKKKAASKLSGFTKKKA